jgi:hypothetical protein
VRHERWWAKLISTPHQYVQWDPEKAVADYWKRIKQQEAQYQEVTPDEGPFIKIMNVGEKIVVNRIEGEFEGGRDSDWARECGTKTVGLG